MTCLLAENSGKGTFLFFLGIFPKKCIINLMRRWWNGRPRMLQHALSREGSNPLLHLGKVAQLGTAPDSEIRQVDFYSRAGSNPVLFLLLINTLRAMKPCLFCYFIPASRRPSG